MSDTFSSKKVSDTFFARHLFSVAVLVSAGVAYAGPWVPDDPLFTRQWPLHNVGQGGRTVDADVDAPEAWRYTRGSPRVTIAVLDDGFDTHHPDLAPNMSSAGRDFTRLPPGDDPGPASAADRHGTAVAGVAAARGDNGIGVTGICPYCTILPLRVRGESSAATAAAFRYALEQGADVVTNSWGYARQDSTEGDRQVAAAIEALATLGRDGRGTLVVFGMTNEVVDNCTGADADIASLDTVVAVGVSDHNDRIGWSGFGECMDLVAPSKPMHKSTIGVVTTDRTGLDGYEAGDYHTTFGGTSAAAPLVAGIAGLLLSLNPDLTRIELQRILEHTADKIDADAAGYDADGFSPRAGHGRVNAARALVPHVKIEVAPDVVAPGEPFTVRVTASAPYGLDTVSWAAVGADIGDLGGPRRRHLDGRAYAVVEWPDTAIDRPGTYVLRADAADARAANPVEGYPHRASQAGDEAVATITVVETDQRPARIPARPKRSSVQHGSAALGNRFDQDDTRGGFLRPSARAADLRRHRRAGRSGRAGRRGGDGAPIRARPALSAQAAHRRRGARPRPLSGDLSHRYREAALGADRRARASRRLPSRHRGESRDRGSPQE